MATGSRRSAAFGDCDRYETRSDEADEAGEDKRWSTVSWRRSLGAPSSNDGSNGEGSKNVWPVEEDDEVGDVVIESDEGDAASDVDSGKDDDDVESS